MTLLARTNPTTGVKTGLPVRCVACRATLGGAERCPSCGRAYPVLHGVLEALGSLEGTNRIAAAFYDGPNWPRFKFWENVFLAFQGPGIDRARRQVLRHLPDVPEARVLEVGVGDGENLGRLPP